MLLWWYYWNRMLLVHLPRSNDNCVPAWTETTTTTQKIVVVSVHYRICTVLYVRMFRMARNLSVPCFAGLYWTTGPIATCPTTCSWHVRSIGHATNMSSDMYLVSVMYSPAGDRTKNHVRFGKNALYRLALTCDRSLHRLLIDCDCLFRRRAIIRDDDSFWRACNQSRRWVRFLPNVNNCSTILFYCIIFYSILLFIYSNIIFFARAHET